MDDRLQHNLDTEIYLMDIDKGQAKNMHLDALYVRNHAAFAAFACLKKLANMEKRKVFTCHWDRAVPHVGLYAKRDIAPGEELSYMRTDEAVRGGAARSCACGHEECTGRL